MLISVIALYYISVIFHSWKMSTMQIIFFYIKFIYLIFKNTIKYLLFFFYMSFL